MTLHFFFHYSNEDLEDETKLLELYGYINKLKEERILKPMEMFLYFLGVPKREFFSYTRKEIEYHLEMLKTRMEERKAAGGPAGKDVVSANDPVVQSLMPDPSGRPHTTPRRNRI